MESIVEDTSVEQKDDDSPKFVILIVYFTFLVPKVKGKKQKEDLIHRIDKQLARLKGKNQDQESEEVSEGAQG